MVRDSNRPTEITDFISYTKSHGASVPAGVCLVEIIMIPACLTLHPYTTIRRLSALIRNMPATKNLPAVAELFARIRDIRRKVNGGGGVARTRKSPPND